MHWETRPSFPILHATSYPYSIPIEMRSLPGKKGRRSEVTKIDSKKGKKLLSLPFATACVCVASLQSSSITAIQAENRSVVHCLFEKTDYFMNSKSSDALGLQHTWKLFHGNWIFMSFSKIRRPPNSKKLSWSTCSTLQTGEYLLWGVFWKGFP